MSRRPADPPMTLPAAAELSEIAADWTAVYCKPRQEKALAWDLHRQEVPYFLPLIMRESYSGGRRRRKRHPMFKSYLFFAGEDPQRLAVLKTNRLVQLVPISDPLQDAFRREIVSLERTLRTAPDKVDLYPQLVMGRRVQVVGGPLAGVEGVILKADDVTQLWVGVAMMGVGVTVKTHADLLEPLESDHQSPPAAGSIEYAMDDGYFVAAPRQPDRTARVLR